MPTYNYEPIIKQEPTNLDIKLGEEYGIIFSLTVKKTLVNRLKYWLLCEFFPFRIVKWEKEE